MERPIQSQAQTDRRCQGRYASQQEQPPMDERHGGGFVPEPQDAPYVDGRHGGGFRPEMEPDRLSNRTYSSQHSPNQQNQDQVRRIQQVRPYTGLHAITALLTHHRAPAPTHRTTMA
jgi:hypothetical protein